MAKRKAQKRKGATSTARKRAPARASGKRPTKKPQAKARVVKKRPRAIAKQRPKAIAKQRPRAIAKQRPRAITRKRAIPKATRLDRARRILEESVPMPPSSLDMKRRGTAVRSGRAEVAERLQEHRGMSSDITAGDVDVDVEDAYFTGDEAPGGDNSTPDQDIVDDIGKALGVEYQDNEELKGADKVEERDRKRWELDPASSEDYKERE
ncbi:MAG TPA: DUF6335 family protein [Vicinamibacterales bacterium]|nr:DUF6335 family protein [Vicinamibacterales bacterium]